MPYFVIGGEFRDTSWSEVVKADRVGGPFYRYQDAYVDWRGKALATVDQAYVRYKIVEARDADEASGMLTLPVAARSS